MSYKIPVTEAKRQYATHLITLLKCPVSMETCHRSDPSCVQQSCHQMAVHHFNSHSVAEQQADVMNIQHSTTLAVCLILGLFVVLPPTTQQPPPPSSPQIETHMSYWTFGLLGHKVVKGKKSDISVFKLQMFCIKCWTPVL